MEGWDLPWDGEIVSDAFPAVIGFHFLGLAIDKAIYHEMFDDLRAAVRIGDSRSDHHVVESLRSTQGYKPYHLVGIAQTTPHIVLSVHLFNERAWRVHLPLLRASSVLTPMGVVMHLKEMTLQTAQPAPMTKPLEVPTA